MGQSIGSIMAGVPVDNLSPAARNKNGAVETAALGAPKPVAKAGSKIGAQQVSPVVEQNKQAWLQALKDPRIKAGLMQMSVNLFSGQGIGRALGGGAAAVGRADQQQVQEAAAAKDANLAERKVALAERKAAGVVGRGGGAGRGGGRGTAGVGGVPTGLPSAGAIKFFSNQFPPTLNDMGDPVGGASPNDVAWLARGADAGVDPLMLAEQYGKDPALTISNLQGFLQAKASEGQGGSVGSITKSTQQAAPDGTPPTALGASPSPIEAPVPGNVDPATVPQDQAAPTPPALPNAPVPKVSRLDAVAFEKQQSDEFKTKFSADMKGAVDAAVANTSSLAEKAGTSVQVASDHAAMVVKGWFKSPDNLPAQAVTDSIRALPVEQQDQLATQVEKVMKNVEAARAGAPVTGKKAAEVDALKAANLSETQIAALIMMHPNMKDFVNRALGSDRSKSGITKSVDTPRIPIGGDASGALHKPVAGGAAPNKVGGLSGLITPDLPNPVGPDVQSSVSGQGESGVVNGGAGATDLPAYVSNRPTLATPVATARDKFGSKKPATPAVPKAFTKKVDNAVVETLARTVERAKEQGLSPRVIQDALQLSSAGRLRFKKKVPELYKWLYGDKYGYPN